MKNLNLSLTTISPKVTAKISFLIAFIGLFCTVNTYAQEHPDFSGYWMPDRTPGGIISFPRSDWPYTAYGAELQEAYSSVFDPTKDESSFFCVQPGMPMSMAQFAPFPIEVIQRENDVTIFFEAWAQYRKVFIEGYDRPDPILTSRMGYSVGRWEGDTLVIEGSFLSERTMGRSLMSDQASFVERLSVIVGEDGLRRLRSNITFTDPVIYTEPIVFRGSWVDSPDTPIMEYVCATELYQQHLERVRGTRY